MILRKPYAFFIKYFRIINLIMAILMAILIYQTTILGSFLNSYVKDYTVANNFVLSNYINFYSYIFCLIIIVLTIVVLSVMFIKQKPKKLYLLNLLISIIVIVLYSVDYNILKDITNGVLDIRVSKAIRDVTFIVLGLQIISFIITLIRAVGFDLKSFEFKKDLQELEIDIKDNEEFEVALELDKNKAKRELRSNIRKFKYFYTEKKFIINIIILIIIIILAFIILINKIMYTSFYSEGRIFSSGGLQFNVRNSYITNKDQNGNTILNKNNYLVIIKMDIKSPSAESDATLNTGLITLQTKNEYGKTNKYNAYIDDIGEPYVDQTLSDEFVSYVLVFEVPKNEIDKSMKLKINDNISYIRGKVGAKNNYVKLKPINLKKATTTENHSVGDMISFSGSILGGTTFKIDKYEIKDKFKMSYNFCSKKDKCYKSYEYLTPTATGNSFKTLLKINGEFELDESMNINNVYDIYTFLNTFATIYYEKNGEVYSEKIDSGKIKPETADDDGATYIEINREIENSNSIYMIFNLRNSMYKYTLK